MMLDNFISWLYTKTIWGPRCPDYDPDCVCCRQWGIHDDLFENKIMNETPKSLQPDTETIAQDKMDAYMKSSEQIAPEFEKVRRANEAAAETLWNSLSYDDKCNAFHAVVSKLCKGDIEVKGSYRYVLYDIFGFGPDMYTRGMECGYMALHNSIMDEDQFAKANKWMLGEDVKD